jgi:hypothetical protein
MCMWDAQYIRPQLLKLNQSLHYENVSYPPLADPLQTVHFYIIIFLIIILGLDFAHK